MIIPCVKKSDTMSDFLTQGNNCNRKYQNRQRIKEAGKDRIQKNLKINKLSVNLVQEDL